MRVEDGVKNGPRATEEQLSGQSICRQEKRVMIISDRPERVRSLLFALSSASFDVFSMHQFHYNLLPVFQPEILIYDGSGVESSERANILSQAKLAGILLLLLLDQQTYERSDDCLGKAELLVWPTRTELVMHRIQWMLGNKSADMLPMASEDIRVFKDIFVDLKRMTVDQGGQRIDLTKTEYDLLHYFITSDGSVLSREALLDAIWGMQFFGGSNVVDVHIKSLRKKLKDSAVAPKYIVTVRGAGYRLADNRDNRRL